MKIITSLAPKRLDIQRLAIESWRRLGADVISFNHKSEVDKIKSSFDGVTFIEAQETAVGLYGFQVPYVSITEILTYIFQCGHPVWIINSDIILDLDREKIHTAESIANRTVVFGCRVDICTIEDIPNGTEYNGGFDYFILGEGIQHLFINNRTKMCMGQPWWDYWVPLMCIRKHVKPIKIATPIAYHVKHEQGWNLDQLLFFGQLVANDIGIYVSTMNELGMLATIMARTIQNQCKKVYI